MINILKSDFYRCIKSKLFYGIMIFTAIITSSLMMIMRQDIRIGISIFGNLTAFKGLKDVIRVGLEYQKGLGILAAILISVLIGQEYQWKTWQHKWITNKSRICIYLSKVIVSSITATTIFLLFELVTLFSSGQINTVLTGEFVATIICGCVIYAALGTVICMLSMLIKNSTASIIVCLCYVLFNETLLSIIRNLSNFSASAVKVVEFVLRHSIYGMSVLISTTSVSANIMMNIIVNSAIIMLITTVIGITVFKRYEL